MHRSRACLLSRSACSSRNDLSVSPQTSRLLRNGLPDGICGHKWAELVVVRGCNGQRRLVKGWLGSRGRGTSTIFGPWRRRVPALPKLCAITAPSFSTGSPRKGRSPAAWSRYEHQRQTRHQKSPRVSNLRSHGNRALSRAWPPTRANIYTQILLRRPKKGPDLACRLLSATARIRVPQRGAIV